MNQSLTFKTAWGWMAVAASQRGVQAIVLPKSSRKTAEVAIRRARISSNGRLTPYASRLTAILEEARTQLVAFLEGKRRELDFPVDLSAGSAFQRRVWRAILPIPYGRVRSYKWVALRVGGTRYARAVGHAMGANPVPLVIPCHRVVAHDASLGGFTGGLRTKRRLLQLEGTLPLLKS
ncbi:MAG: methylated-DNA--[protein]-cysteine S-methyltransferase [Nitrospiraceae bacterium]